MATFVPCELGGKRHGQYRSGLDSPSAANTIQTTHLIYAGCTQYRRPVFLLHGRTSAWQRRSIQAGGGRTVAGPGDYPRERRQLVAWPDDRGDEPRAEVVSPWRTRRRYLYGDHSDMILATAPALGRCGGVRPGIGGRSRQASLDADCEWGRAGDARDLQQRVWFGTGRACRSDLPLRTATLGVRRGGTIPHTLPGRAFGLALPSTRCRVPGATSAATELDAGARPACRCQHEAAADVGGCRRRFANSMTRF